MEKKHTHTHVNFTDSELLGYTIFMQFTAHYCNINLNGDGSADYKNLTVRCVLKTSKDDAAPSAPAT